MSDPSLMAERAAPPPPSARSRTGEGVALATEPHACFGCGDQNPIGLQMPLRHGEGGVCWSEMEIPERFQGWEGIVHGGVISTLLDEVMVWSLVDRDLWGVTARITVNFKKPVMVGRRIRAEGWIVAVRRRLVDTAGRIIDVETGIELATAEATMVGADEAKKEQLQQRYGDLFGRLQTARDRRSDAQ